MPLRIDRPIPARHCKGMITAKHGVMITAWAAALLSLGGCVSIATELPDVSAPTLANEQARQEVSAFSELARLRERLDRVAYPVLRENTALCPKTRYDFGVKTHSLKSYSKALRPAAARELGAGDSPTVIYVRPGSAADKAGISVGDAVLNEAGKAVPASSKALQAAFKSGERSVSLKSGESLRRVDVEPVAVCGYAVRLRLSTAVNAYANGRNITITSGLMDFTTSDSELALIVGHELAHNTMGHIRKVATNYILSFGATRYTRPFELESDYVGLYYIARAGFALDGVEDIWRRMALLNPRAVARAKTHPTYPDRLLRMSAARDEIAAKRAAGDPLVPNFKQGAVEAPLLDDAALDKVSLESLGGDKS